MPLRGVRVLDCSRVLAGPFCTQTLGDLGAEVVKVEAPMGDDTRRWGPPWAGSESAYYLFTNRNKRDIVLDLGRPEGREVLRALAAQADVLIENFKVGTMERWGLGYETLKQENPRLIYCSITGYGPDGPYAQRPGYDFILQAESGIMSLTGEPDGEPLKAGVPVVDITTGLYATIGILAALQARHATGRGQRIDLSLLATGVTWLSNFAQNYLVSGEPPLRYANSHPNVAPYGAFRARDQYLAIGVGNDGQFRRLCEILGHPEWAADPRWADNPGRLAQRESLEAEMAPVLRERDAADWLAALGPAGVPCGPINTVPQILADPQVAHLGLIAHLPHPMTDDLRVIGPPYRLSETPAAARTAPPLLGEHSEAILIDWLGYGADQIAGLRERGVLGTVPAVR